MPRFRAPANVQLRRAQLTLMLATLLPTVLMTALGIVLLAIGRDTPTVVSGVLVLAFCTSSLTGYILGSIFVSRGASVARFQNDFLSSVSHELRTPLTSIGMFIETLRDERLTDPDEQDKCLSLMEQEIRRLRALVERLLELSHIESGQHGFGRERVSVDELVESAIAAFEAASLNDRAAVDARVEGGLEVVGDPQALAQALTNLLVNAWKYTPSGDRELGLDVSSTSRWVEIRVRDNGPGIPRTEQRQIFERFERGKSAIDGPQRGSGLGLAIVRAIVRAHGGRIDVRSKPGQGSEFRVRLRRAQEQ